MKKIEGIFFPEHAKGYDEMMEKIVSEFTDIPENFNEKLKELTPELIENYDTRSVDFVLGLFNNDVCSKKIADLLQIQNEITSSYFEIFKYLFAYLQGCYEIQLKINNQIREDAKSLSKWDNVVIGLYAYIFRIADQIATMIASGSPDGAMRLWRSFYEYSCSLIYILNNKSEELAQRFIDFGFIAKYRQIECYKVRHEELKFPPIDNQLDFKIEKRRETLESLYGRSFLKDEWNWAIIDHETKRMTFRDLEAQIGINRFRPFYLWACTYTHSSFDALLDFYEQENGYFNMDSVTRARMDKRALIDPIQLTCGVLHEINAKFLEEVSIPHEYDVNLLLFRRILDLLHKSFE